jgi:flagellar hook-basal body complex protein FliE
MRLELLGTSLGSKSILEPDQSQVPSGNFFEYLNNALQSVDNLQKDASAGAQKLALGDEEYLHNTVLAYERASLALQLTLEIRNRIVEAYQELMRIQM